ncbi:MAG: hypothetical protein B6D61_09785 [Bacteroidetes bacterium 4484_249]|nr:MAG: hypothetical protein B6D61_09785 [Bacteroidetes bacterium 4484_249]
MRKITLIYSLFIPFIWITSCTTTKSVVSDSANLEKYNYATITNVMDYSGAAALMNIEVEIYDALSSSRLKVIGDKELESLSDIQKQELLLVRFSASQSDDESVVSINFTDYMTGKPVASCRGAYAFGLTKQNDMKVALNKAIEQMKKLF